MLFYGLAAWIRRHAANYYLATIAGCAMVWEWLGYAQVSSDYYLLLYAVLGVIGGAALAPTANVDAALNALLQRREVRVAQFLTKDYLAKLNPSDAMATAIVLLALGVVLARMGIVSVEKLRDFRSYFIVVAFISHTATCRVVECCRTRSFWPSASKSPTPTTFQSGSLTPDGVNSFTAVMVVSCMYQAASCPVACCCHTRSG